MTVVNKTVDLDEAFKFFRDKTGQVIQLTEPSNGQRSGSLWVINAVNKLGTSVVVSASPHGSKGRGYFFPISAVELVEMPVEEAPAPMEFETPDRNEFVFLPGMDEASPLAAIFRKSAPNTEAAQGLYMLYANEYSEYDTELMLDLLSTLDIGHGLHWSPMTISNLQMMLDRVQTVEVTEIPVVETVEISRHEEIVEISRQEEEVMPEAFEITTEVESIRRRGRPPGSKNKPKTMEEQVQQAETTHAAKTVRKQPEPLWEDDVKLGTISNGFATMTIEQFQDKFKPTEVPSVNIQNDETFEQVYTDLKDKHFQKELHIFVGQMLEYLNNTATDPRALLTEATKVVSGLI
jgi:hypothetical protein